MRQCSEKLSGASLTVRVSAQALAEEPPLYPADLLLDILRVALLPPPEAQYGDAGGFSGGFDEGYSEDQGEYAQQYDGGAYGMSSEYDDGSAYSGEAPAEFLRDDGLADAAGAGPQEQMLAGGDAGSSQWQQPDGQEPELQTAFSDGAPRSWPLEQPDAEGFNNDFPNDWQAGSDDLSAAARGGPADL